MLFNEKNKETLKKLIDEFGEDATLIEVMTAIKNRCVVQKVGIVYDEKN